MYFKHRHIDYYVENITLLDEPFLIYDDKVNVLVVENQREFLNLVSDIEGQTRKMEGSTVFSDESKLSDVSKAVEFVYQYYPFEINRKALLTKLYSVLRERVNSEFMPESLELASEIQQFIFSVMDTMDCELTMDDFECSILFKSMNVRFADEYESLPEAIIDYCKNVVALLGDKIFVFVSLQCFVTPEEYQELTKTLLQHKYTILLIENTDRASDTYRVSENRLVIDSNYSVL